MIEAANAATDPTRFFEIDPAVLLATHRRARAGGLRVVGHYHSHPGGDLRPSANDASHAVETSAIWLIASATDLTAWRFDGRAGFALVDLVFMP